MTDLIPTWGREFFPHLTPVYQRLAIEVLMRSIFSPMEGRLK